MNEKVNDDGESKIKARLTVMGNREPELGIRTDSPTASKTNTKIMLLIAGSRGWKIFAMDIESAFLQTEETTRDIFVFPPVEAEVPRNKIWKLIRPVYGTRDAARAFYNNLSKELEQLGCRKLSTDYATYTWNDEQGLAGVICTHVDDILAAGNKDFRKKVLEPLKEIFTFGEDKEDKFKYTGVQIEVQEDGIVLNGNQSINDLRVPDLKTLEEQNEGELEEEGQSAFRSFVGQLSALNNQVRPDISFPVKEMAVKQNKATKADMRKVRALVKRMKEDPFQIKLSKLEETYEDWILLTFADASYKGLADKVSSVGGIITFMVNRNDKKCHLLEWSSHKLTRVCTSPFSAESLNITQAIGRLALLKKNLVEIMGPEVGNKISTVIATDSKNSMDLANSSSNIQDGWNALDTAVIRESLEKGVLDKMIKVSTEDQLADALTKNKPSSVRKLRETLMTGTVENLEMTL